MIRTGQSVFSVWDDGLERYDYYVGRDTPPSAIRSEPNPQLGAVPEDAADRLPIGARKVGSGDVAIGHIAEPGINMYSVGRFALMGLAAYGAWMLFKSGKVKRWLK